MTIRAEVESDIPAIAGIVRRAFENEGEVRLVDLIRQRSEALLSLVYEQDGAIVGHVLVSPITIDGVAGSFGGLAPLSVEPRFQGAGIGGELMRAAEAAMREQGCDALFLLRHPGYYPRFGYQASHIGNEYGATDAFMHLELTPGCLAGKTGTARYVSAFADSAT